MIIKPYYYIYICGLSLLAGIVLGGFIDLDWLWFYSLAIFGMIIFILGRKGKAGHHGSKILSGLDFLPAVNPDFVIISVGRDNRYGHPHRRVLNNIDKVGAKVLRTDLSGRIHLQFDGASVVRQ